MSLVNILERSHFKLLKAKTSGCFFQGEAETKQRKTGEGSPEGMASSQKRRMDMNEVGHLAGSNGGDHLRNQPLKMTFLENPFLGHIQRCLQYSFTY